MTSIDELARRAGAAAREQAETLVPLARAPHVPTVGIPHARRRRARWLALSGAVTVAATLVAVLATASSSEDTPATFDLLSSQLSSTASPQSSPPSPLSTSPPSTSAPSTSLPSMSPPSTSPPPIEPTLSATIPVANTVGLAMTAADGFIWAAPRTGSGGVVAIDSATNRIAATVAGTGSAKAMAAGFGALWACGDDTVRIDPTTAEIVARYPVACRAGITTGYGSVWVENYATLTRLDPASGDVITTIPIAFGGSGVAAGAGSIWVAEGRLGPGVLTRVDPQTNAVIATIEMPWITRGIVATDTAVWVAAGPDPKSAAPAALLRIDPATNTIQRTYPEPSGASLALLGPFLWVVGYEGSVFVVDTRSGDVVSRPPLRPADFQVHGDAGLAVGDGSIWLSTKTPGAVERIDPGSFGGELPAADAG